MKKKYSQKNQIKKGNPLTSVKPRLALFLILTLMTIVGVAFIYSKDFQGTSRNTYAGADTNTLRLSVGPTTGVSAIIGTPITPFAAGTATRKAFVNLQAGVGTNTWEAGWVYYPGISGGSPKSYYQYINANKVVKYVELSNNLGWGNSRSVKILSNPNTKTVSLFIADTLRASCVGTACSYNEYSSVGNIIGVRASNSTDKMNAQFRNVQIALAIPQTFVNIKSSSDLKYGGTWQTELNYPTTFKKSVYNANYSFDIYR